MTHRTQGKRASQRDWEQTVTASGQCPCGKVRLLTKRDAKKVLRRMVPGDRLYPESGSAYRQHLFNFRDEDEPGPEPGPDARGGGYMPEGDELGTFIAGWHAWRRSMLNMEGS